MVDPAILLAAVLIIGGAAILSLAASLVTRRWIQSRLSEGHNDVAGFIFATIGVIYAVLLAFVVFAVWDRFSKADDAVSSEAAALVTVYRDAQVLPPPQRHAAQQALISYARTVPAKEWSSHGTLVAHTTPDPLNPVWAAFRAVKPTTTLGEGQLLAAEVDIHQLEVLRHQRHLGQEASLPWIFWPVLIAGALITVGFALAFSIENGATHAVLTAVLAGCVASILFLIFGLDHPYTGMMHVSNQPFEHAILQFHALDNGTPEQSLS